MAAGARLGADPTVATRELGTRWLAERGVLIEDIARLVLDLQQGYVPGLGMADCVESVGHVLGKREVCNAILTGIALDTLAERGLLPAPLQEIVQGDDHLYGIDEVLALSIVNIYGSIGFTSFGYLDKVKPGIVGLTDQAGRDGRQVNTFLDDLIAAVAAAAAARIAHDQRDGLLEEDRRRNGRPGA